ncbi:MAG: hypothetical protein IJT18_04980 [Oscillospiraceae bacterium]|nr:hypothetical protein [Oscillospiraceae bacterium]
MKLIHDKPTSQGMENALKRAAQLRDLRWTPVRQFPCTYLLRALGAEKQTAYNGWHEPYRAHYGIPYSGSRVQEKFVGYNVSIDTFMTALQNPNSVLYTEPQFKRGSCMNSYYGTVCSVFTGYALCVPYRVPCREWPELPYIERVDYRSPDDLQLCDLLITHTAGHIVMVTDIARDESGRVREITVSEETPPSCLSLPYTPEAFTGYWIDNPFCRCTVYRCTDFSRVTYKPNPYIPLPGDPELPVLHPDPTFLPDLGDRFNCEVGEKVSFTVLKGERKEISVTEPDGATVTLPVQSGRAAFRPLKTGFYRAVCDGAGEPVSWYVTGMTLEQERNVFAPDETIRARVHNPNGDPVFAYNISTEEFDSVKNGVFAEKITDGVLEFPALKPGSYRIFVVAKNEYGCYRSTRISVTVR